MVAALSFSMLASSAHADWSEASSENFIIYGDQSEKSLRLFAERLELFHATMAEVLRKAPPKPSLSSRVTIFVVSSDEEVRKLIKANDSFMTGVYRPRAGATVALVPQLRHAKSRYELAPEAVLYHEYAHHFMYGITARAYPRWFVEGFAEFFSGVRFESKQVDLGTPAEHRTMELVRSTHVPIRELLSMAGGKREPNSRYNAFYGQSWALFHCLQFSRERAGQLGRYQALLGQGMPALEAADNAFGDLDELAKDVRIYWNRASMVHLSIPREKLPISQISVSKLPPGAAAMMPITMRSKIGLSEEDAAALLPEAQQVAAQYPEDAHVLAILAAVELAAGNDDAAIATADRALAIAPKNIAAQLQKAYAVFHKVESGALPKESWTWARNELAKANAIENDHPIPLIQFYRSYRVQGLKPTQNAVDGLAAAMQLAPFDSSVRWMVSQQLIADNRLEEGTEVLAPLAYSPHRNEFTDRALKLLTEVQARIESGQGQVSAGGSP